MSEQHVKIANDDDGEVKRKFNRTLTQRYDMHQLKKLQVLEEKYMALFAQIYGVDKDDLDIDLDILQLFNIINDNERRTKLQQCLKDAPSSTDELISQLLQEMTAIHEQLIHEQK